MKNKFAEPHEYKGTVKVIDDSKDRLREFIEFIHKYEPLDEIKEEIFLLVGIRKSEEEIAQQVSELVEKGDFTTAIRIAKEKQLEGYYEIIWELVILLHQSFLAKGQELISLYESISEQNPHYKKANSRLVTLYAPDSFPSDRSNPYFYLERQLDAAIKSDEQQLFHQLCGHKDLIPQITNVKGSASTLIAFAAQIRNLRMENLNLRKENNDLKQKAHDDQTEIKYNSPAVFIR